MEQASTNGIPLQFQYNWHMKEKDFLKIHSKYDEILSSFFFFYYVYFGNQKILWLIRAKSDTKWKQTDKKLNKQILAKKLTVLGNSDRRLY